MNFEVKTGIYNFKGTEMSFNYYTDLSAVDKMRFVNSVTDIIVGDNYNSIIKDLIFDFEIIDIFTDIDLSEIRDSSDNINLIEEFVKETLVVDIVKANSKDFIIDELKQAVDDNIEYKTGVHSNSFTTSLSHLLKTIESKIVGIDTQGMMEMAQKINSISGELTADKILDAYSKTDMFKQKQAEIAEKIDRNITNKE